MRGEEKVQSAAFLTVALEDAGGKAFSALENLQIGSVGIISLAHAHLRQMEDFSPCAGRDLYHLTGLQVLRCTRDRRDTDF